MSLVVRNSIVTYDVPAGTDGWTPNGTMTDQYTVGGSGFVAINPDSSILLNLVDATADWTVLGVYSITNNSFNMHCQNSGNMSGVTLRVTVFNTA